MAPSVARKVVVGHYDDFTSDQDESRERERFLTRMAKQENRAIFAVAVYPGIGE